jgi:hypothetical protein
MATINLGRVKGDQGPQGTQGDQGPQGYEGPHGPQGPAGEGGGLADAPIDGEKYVRKDGAWVVIDGSTPPANTTKVTDSTGNVLQEESGDVIPNNWVSYTLAPSVTAVTFKPTVTSIGNYAFGYTGLTSVTFPDSVTSIGVGAFRSCTSLTSITIPDNLTTIGSGAFFFCINLSTPMVFPDSVTSIGSGAFSYVITTFEVGPNNPSYSTVNGVLFNKDQTVLVKYPELPYGGGLGYFSIPAGVTTLEADSLANMGIGFLNCPSSLTTIGSNALVGNSVNAVTFTSTHPPSGGISGSLSYVYAPAAHSGNWGATWNGVTITFV